MVLVNETEAVAGVAREDAVFSFRRIIDFLVAEKVNHRVMVHPPEGQTVAASLLRGHSVEQAAKCMVVEVKHDNGQLSYVLAVVSGNRRVALKNVAGFLEGVKAKLAPSHIASQLTRCVMGAVPPISFDDRLQVVVDRGLLSTEEIVFSAGRLDVSIGVNTDTYLNVIRHQIGSISE
ncbi:YbaK/EbsC family protein [Paraburkholderia megapolitana]|uniref:Ala-tRNA(Pro) deacylase n=1 Tax=Paraburkholderia megapolitana TaxID=420953 RepID=A0A1I3RNP0_9BURK|nr:YbaK/EbsC family protein [Paraburkholderia megapolitana]QDQ83928.1 YbaK/prolyl-tRNA synthetase associated domain-containing protein [Paraburkholderia megapolitana]SFJ46877.1 Ala-tRNA(Pro) deacylase [Paraburkholderia megapolitana]